MKRTQDRHAKAHECFGAGERQIDSAPSDSDKNAAMARMRKLSALPKWAIGRLWLWTVAVAEPTFD